MKRIFYIAAWAVLAALLALLFSQHPSCGDPTVRRTYDTVNQYKVDSICAAWWKHKSDSLNRTKREE